MSERKPSPMTELAARIHAHLQRFASDKTTAQRTWIDGNGKERVLTLYWNPVASRAGSRIKIRYINYQYENSLTRDEAVAYLAWLDAGNVGRHR